MRAVVVGADGFVGRWLLRHLLDSGDDAVAIVGPAFDGKALPGDLVPVLVDVRDASSVSTAMSDLGAEAIFYLSAVSAAAARNDPRLAIGVSVVGSLNVLAAGAAAGLPCRFIHAGSAHVYRPSTDPLNEASPLAPVGTYGAAKAAAERALRTLGPSVGIKVIAARAFNHTGPGQSPDFVVPALARQVARVQRGEQDPHVSAADLDARRDFTDVRDVVRAYRLLALHGRGGRTYNIASGRAVSVRSIARSLIRESGVRARVLSAPQSQRQPSSPIMVGDALRIRQETGWRPTIRWAHTLRDVLADW